MRDKYGLEKHLDELSRAVEAHEGSPVGDAKIVLKGCGVGVSLEGDAAGSVGRNGVYEIELKPKTKGQMVLGVYYRGRAFSTRSIKAQ